MSKQNTQTTQAKLPQTADAFAAQFDVSRETLARLVAYQALLGKWQKSINLVGPATLEHFWSRHVADSAQILAYAPKAAECWLDLGSGAGFPALVLAIMLTEMQPLARVHMIEGDRKKANFLRTVLTETGIKGEVHHARIEAVATDRPSTLEAVDVVTARALAGLPDLLSLMQPFFNSSTVALLHKGRNWQEELTAAQQYWKLKSVTYNSLTEDSARILALSDLQPKR